MEKQLLVQIVEAVRDFELWLKPLGVTVSNVFKPHQGRPAAHSIAFKVRTDLTPAEAAAWQAAPGNRRAPPGPEDVFAVCKGRMYMTQTKTPVLTI